MAGLATCTVGERTLVVGEGGRIDVPRGAAHRISNEEDDALVLLEVQLGDYLGEDDVARLSDDHGR